MKEVHLINAIRKEWVERINEEERKGWANHNDVNELKGIFNSLKPTDTE
tara:strand:+ start:43 stop:189 length:147 start_codon:yes stop_codon:yes gene_type:complete